MPYSIGPTKLISVILAAGLISRISLFPKEKTAELSADPLAAKETSRTTSSPEFRITSQRVIFPGWVLNGRGTNSRIFLPISGCAPELDSEGFSFA
jgi:hypothetical protein